MEQFQKQIRNPWAVSIACLVIGMIFGLVVLGWWLFPVEWTDATAADLNNSNQVMWIQMAAAEYELTQDAVLALSRYDALGENKQNAILETSNSLGTLSPETFAAYVMVVEPENAANIMMGIPIATAESQEDKPGNLTALLTIFFGILVAILAAVGIFFILRKLATRQDERKVEEFAEEPEVVKTGTPAESVDIPFAQFMSTYRLGDDLYDDSFSIDSPQGEFMGECGAGISEPIGVGDPKKVTAIDVWLFDKNDIQTVTKVLMSQHAFDDIGIRNRLIAKGEPVLVAPGDEIILETQSLSMVVNVVDMSYGEGPLPPESFFERMVLDLSVWSKGSN
jgi:hypothetical protein